MKWLKRIFLGLLLLVVLGWLLRAPLMEALRGPVNEYLKNFPESKFLHAEAPGSYPAFACHNSHVDWGEQVRITQSLDGVWDIAQGALDEELPTVFDHEVPVPGFITEALPPFARVGVDSDEREAFWYRTHFTAPEQGAALAALCLHKAKYGVQVWLNGQSLGEHHGAFSLSEYDLSNVIRYGQQNELVVRVGAVPGAVPEFIPIGADLEKHAFYPGLWDSVSVVYTGPVSIVRNKIEPNIDTGEVLVHTAVRNNGPDNATVTLKQAVRPWSAQQVDKGLAQGLAQGLAKGAPLVLEVSPGETVTATQVLPMPAARLWTPEDPHLYRLHTVAVLNGKASDDRVVRFGMRKVEWRAGTDKGFYLNNRLYYLRGTNIALHRFFEDPARGQLPWRESWVRELLSGHMKDFHWNSFRFHIGRAPNFWYDLADEIGLVVADEYHIFAPIRLGIPGMPSSINWSQAELEKEFTGWVQENWNHASIGWWDASNENHNPIPYAVVPLVRHLDETRAWDSGSYRAPDRPNDPLEDHPYKLNGTSFLNSNPRPYLLEDLDQFDRQPPQSVGIVFATWDGEGAREHAYLNNEYAWLWLTRDGSDATPIAEVAYDLLAPGVELSPEQRRELYAYVASELSAYWRAGRGYAGVQHFLYLGKCIDVDEIEEGADIAEASATCDNFIDVPSLTMEPRWARWAPQAFSPVAINIDRWSRAFYAPGELAVPVTLLNDTYLEQAVSIRLIAAAVDGEVLAEAVPVAIDIPPLGKVNTMLEIDFPDVPGVVLYASIEGAFGPRPVYSRRKIGLEHPGVLATLPADIQRNIERD